MNALLLVRPVSCELFLSEAKTRVPFRFGATTLQRATIVTAKVAIESEHGRHEGFSSDLLVPGWFRKDPARTPSDDENALFESASAAGRALLTGASDDTVFAHWLRVWRERVEAPGDAAGALERGFGVALAERALIDATCRAAGVTFFDAVRRDLLGFEPGRVHPELARRNVAASLPARTRTKIDVRHTVGLLDELRSVGASHGDGLPGSLEEEIARYELRRFKLKLRGEVAADRARLLEIARLLRERCTDAVCTLDGNEQFRSLADLAELLRSLRDDPDGAWLAQRIAYVEQPLARARTLDRAAHADIGALREHAPLILDEADDSLAAFERAFALGYRGVSVKNCKGVFRALLQRGLCERWGDGAFQSGEDLTNLGVLALQQDLATMALLDLPHVERNGHHYFRGLAHLPPQEAADALREHADLYEPLGDTATLRIRGGELALGSLDCVGYGYQVRIRTEGRAKRT